MVDRCPRCGLAFERGDGFWLGAMAVNLGATEAVFGAFVVIGLMMTWPDVPWIPLTVFGVLLNATVPFLFYPSSKTIFLAFDLVLHQAEIPDAPELEATEPSARLPRPDETAPRFLSSRRRAELVNDSARGHPAWPAPSPP